jgi:ATP-dependent DNA helicase RecG
MRPQQLRALIQAGQSADVAFLGELEPRALVETAVALANRSAPDPAWLIIGVNAAGKVCATSALNPDQIIATIARNTCPTLKPTPVIVQLDSKEIVALRIPPHPFPVSTITGRCLRRTLDAQGKPIHCPIDPGTVYKQLARDDSTMAVLPDVSWDDLDPLEFERFRRFIRESYGFGDISLLHRSNRDVARALGAISANGDVRLLGLLLFGKDEAIRRLCPNHAVVFNHSEVFQGPLLRMIEDLKLQFAIRHRERELIVGFQRIGVPNYPPLALLEGLVNALIHRDYAASEPICINWDDSEVVISNPGSLPEALDLLAVPQRPRNPLLASAIWRAGVVPTAKRGIRQIYYEHLRTGRPAPRYEAKDGRVRLCLPGGPADLRFVRLVVETNQALRHPLTLEELLVLSRLLFHGIIQDEELEHDSTSRLVALDLIERNNKNSWKFSEFARKKYLDSSFYFNCFNL